MCKSAYGTNFRRRCKSLYTAIERYRDAKSSQRERIGTLGDASCASNFASKKAVFDVARRKKISERVGLRQDGRICGSVELVRFVVYVDFIVELCAHRALLIYMYDWRFQGETQW